MLFYVLIAMMILNAFIQDGATTNTVTDTKNAMLLKMLDRNETLLIGPFPEYATPVPKCKDYSPLCKQYRVKGWCNGTSHIDVKGRCRKTCGFC